MTNLMNRPTLSFIKSVVPEKSRKKYRYWRARLLSIGLSQSTNYSLAAEEIKASAAISVIVPIHDAPDVTERCLASLERNAGDAEVIIIDDGSKQSRTLQIINRAVARRGWSVFRRDNPSGHSRACERGAEMAQRNYLCFLNSDTVVTPFSWAGIVKVFNDDPNVGVVGPSTSRTSTIQSVRRAELCCPFWSDAQIDDFAFKYTTKNKGSATVDLDFAGGFSFYITRPAWDAGGGFDPALKNYGNETDLCQRLKRKGFTISWTKESYIHHFGESSFKQYFTHEELRRQRINAQRFIDSKK